MGETWNMIHSEANFLSDCESVEPNNLHASKIQRKDRDGINMTLQKGRSQKEERDDGTQASP